MSIYPENETIISEQDVWTIQKILVTSTNWLNQKSVAVTSTPRLDVEILLADSLMIDRLKLFLQLDRPLNKSERENFKSKLRRRGEGEPIAYIIGYRDFYRHRFTVSNAVLIPRPDTEILVESVINAAKLIEAPKILDIGTGSGCVAISLASELPDSKVSGWDVSSESLIIAEKNRLACNMDNVTFINRDALDERSYVGEKFDLIASNPPYISQSEIKLVCQESLLYEPKIALFPTDDDGLTFYKVFAKYAGNALNERGKIFMETGFNQAAKVAQLFSDIGWRKIFIVRDLRNIERVVCAERPE